MRGIVDLKKRPQRIARPAGAGDLLKRAVALHVQRKLERARELLDHDPAYLAMIRQLPCLKCGLEPCGEAAHVRLTSAAFHKYGGMGKKPADRWTVPLDSGCHTRDHDGLHRVGEFQFWHDAGINPLLICQRLHAAKGDLVRMRAVILAAMAERR
jgi:hypothetical protein